MKLSWTLHRPDLGLFRLDRDGNLVFPKTLLLDFSVILWLCNAPLRLVIAKVLSMVGHKEAQEILTGFIIYTPILLYILISGKIPWKYFHWFLIACAGFFGITYLMHPEYEHWLTRDAFGISDSIFSPIRGAIWGFFMIEISGDVKRLWRNFQFAAAGTFLYQMYLWVQAKRAGYWDFVDSSGAMARRPYSLDFGYAMAFVLLVVFVTYTFEKKRWMLLMSALCGILILDSGSRGSLVCLFAFALLFLVDAKWNKKERIRNFFAVSAAGGIALLSMNYLIKLIVILADKFHITSRTITMLAEGEAMDDNGRGDIHKLILTHIKEKPLTGYGAFGDRQFIGPKFNWGYSHSIVYEMWADFGVILGTLFLGGLVFLIAKAIFEEKDARYRGAMMVVASVGARLALSNTFWGDPYFWMMVALLTKWLFDLRKRNPGISAQTLLKQLQEAR